MASIWRDAPAMRACNRLRQNAQARSTDAATLLLCGIATGGCKTHSTWVAEGVAGRLLKAEAGRCSEKN